MELEELVREWLSCLSCLPREEFKVERGSLKITGPERFGKISIGDVDIKSDGRVNVTYVSCGLKSNAFKSFCAGYQGLALGKDMNEFYYERGKDRRS